MGFLDIYRLQLAFEACLLLEPLNSNGFFSMQQVLGRFLSVFAFIVAFPADKVLELTTVNTTVNDGIDFVFFFTLNNYRFRQEWLA
jgi:hypothetical protein